MSPSFFRFPPFCCYLVTVPVTCGTYSLLLETENSYCAGYLKGALLFGLVNKGKGGRNKLIIGYPLRISRRMVAMNLDPLEYGMIILGEFFPLVNGFWARVF